MRLRRAAAVAWLLVLLAGPLHAQAEAAEALGRSIAEITCPDVIEPTEPSVGGAALSASSLPADPHPGPIPPSLAFAGFAPGLPYGPLFAQGSPPSRPRTGEASDPPPAHPSRPRLCVFRF